MTNVTQNALFSRQNRAFVRSCVFVLLCTILSVIFASLGVIVRGNTYEARIDYHYSYKLTFMPWGLVWNDLKQNFNNPDVLASWLEANPSQKLKPKDWLDFKIVDDVKLQKSPHEMLVSFRKSKASGVLIVKTDNLQTLDAIYRYLNFLNEKITEEYAEKARWEIDNLVEVYETKHAKKLELIGPYRIWSRKTQLQRDINNLNNGKYALQISRPGSPKQTNLVMAPIFWGGIFGFAMGCLLVATRHAKDLFFNNES